MNRKPNIIFFFTDQQRWDTLGCYGQKLNVTPNIDRMAEQGVKFENAFTCQPVCGPARSCLQLGKYAAEIGCFKNGIALPLNEKTIANYFSESGYKVGYVGKWHLASTTGEFDYRTKAIPLERRGGYKDYWVASDLLEFTSHGYDGYIYDADMNKREFKGYRADCVTDFVLDFLNDYKSNKPFFLFVSYIEPHFQNDHKCFEGPIGSKEKFKDYEIPEDLKDTEGDWKENYPDYLGCCASLDFNLGRIRDKVKEIGEEDNTTIFFTSDHGCHFKTRNSEYKRSCHESSIRIPMIADGSGFKGGKVIKELVSLIDIPSTLLACADIKKPDNMQGRPLQQLVEGNSENWPKEIFVQISESQVGRAIRTKKWKYSVHAEGKDGTKDAESNCYIEDFLYDLENDYSEKNNLIRDPLYVEIRQQLADILKRRMKEANEKEPEILPAH